MSEAPLHEIVSELPRKPYAKDWRGVTLSCGHTGIIHKAHEIGASVPCTHCVTDAMLAEHTPESQAGFVKAPCGCWHYMSSDPYVGTDYEGIIGGVCRCGQHDRKGNPVCNCGIIGDYPYEHASTCPKRPA